MPKNNWVTNPVKKFEDTRKAVKRDHPRAYKVADEVLPIIITTLVELVFGGGSADQKKATPAPRPQ